MKLSEQLVEKVKQEPMVKEKKSQLVNNKKANVGKFPKFFNFSDSTEKIYLVELRSFPCFALRILTAHNLWRHLHALVHAHIENMEDLS